MELYEKDRNAYLQMTYNQLREDIRAAKAPSVVTSTT
jgi:hypothetical protein